MTILNPIYHLNSNKQIADLKEAVMTKNETKVIQLSEALLGILTINNN
mgnify:CR=1 FL=1